MTDDRLADLAALGTRFPILWLRHDCRCPGGNISRLVSREGICISVSNLPTMNRLSLCIILLLAKVVASAADRPNILFFAVDDLRPEFNAYGANYVKSPNLD